MAANTRLSQIQHATLSSYEKYDVTTKKGDEGRGRKDGAQCFPEANDEVHHFKQELIGHARSTLRNYAAQLSSYVSELEAREASLSKRIDEGLSVQREQLTDRYQEQRNTVERTLGASSPRQSSIRQAYDNARDKAQEIEAQLGRPLRIHLRWVYFPILVLVALCEVPINRFAFELYFSESPVISLGISLTIGIIFALFAHFLGSWLKRSTGSESLKAKLGAYAGAILILAIIIPSIYAIALMREHYVNFIESTSQSFKDLLQTDGIGSLVSEVASNELSTAGWTLLLLNVIVISVGAIAAFVRHDAHPDYEPAVRRQDKLERKLKAIEARYEKATSKIQKDYEAKKESLDKSFKLAMDELQSTRHQIRQSQDHRGTVLERVVAHMMQRLNAYEYANRRERSDKATPGCFGATERELTDELATALESDIPPDGARIKRVV